MASVSCVIEAKRTPEDVLGSQGCFQKQLFCKQISSGTLDVTLRREGGVPFHPIQILSHILYSHGFVQSCKLHGENFICRKLDDMHAKQCAQKLFRLTASDGGGVSFCCWALPGQRGIQPSRGLPFRSTHFRCQTTLRDLHRLCLPRVYSCPNETAPDPSEGLKKVGCRARDWRKCRMGFTPGDVSPPAGAKSERARNGERKHRTRHN